MTRILIEMLLMMGKVTLIGEHWTACEYEEKVDRDYIYYNYKKTECDMTQNRMTKPLTSMSKLRTQMECDPMSESVSFLTSQCVG